MQNLAAADAAINMLERQVPLRLLAAVSGDPRGGQGRQPQNQARPDVDAAAHGALPRSRVGAPRAGQRAPPVLRMFFGNAPAGGVTSHQSRRACYAFVQQLLAGDRRDRPSPHLGGAPFPHRGRAGRGARKNVAEYIAAANYVDPAATRLVTGLAGGSGSTVGPGGALYVTEPAAGRVSRVDPQTGVVTTYASGLPPLIPAVGIGGAMDVAFFGGTAYVLVTLVGPDVGGDDVVGIYRVDGPHDFTVIADIGAWRSPIRPPRRSTSSPACSTRWRSSATGSS